MPNLDWKHYTVAALLLACLATWGAREKHWTKTMTEERVARSLSEETTKSLRTEKEKLVKDLTRASETNKKRREERRPDGTIIITEEELTKATETAKETATREISEELASAYQKIDQLEVKLKTVETLTVKSAPKLAAFWEKPVLSFGDIAQHRIGVGFNLGSLSIGVLNPVALQFEPHVLTTLRF